MFYSISSILPQICLFFPSEYIHTFCAFPTHKFATFTDRLYLVVFKNDLTPINSPAIHYFSIDDELLYESFFNDFGPLNICMLYRYCQKLNRKLNTNLHSKKRIVHYTSIDAQHRLNSAFLIGAFSVSECLLFLFSLRTQCQWHEWYWTVFCFVFVFCFHCYYLDHQFGSNTGRSVPNSELWSTIHTVLWCILRLVQF